MDYLIKSIGTDLFDNTSEVLVLYLHNIPEPPGLPLK